MSQARERTRTCVRCGFDFIYTARSGPPRKYCNECRDPRDARGRALQPIKVEDLERVLQHCELRLAVESALALMRMGRWHEAQFELEMVPARGRVRGVRVTNRGTLEAEIRSIPAPRTVHP